MDCVALGLVLLISWYVSANSTSTESWIMLPQNGESFTKQPRDGSSAWPTGMIMPRNFKSSRDTINNRGQGGPLPCGTYNLNPGQTVTIQSQNYPYKYPAGYSCQWTFQGTSSESSISITCTDFRLQYCKYSFVIITGEDLYKKYCWVQDPFTETSKNNQMQVFFKTLRRQGYGFSCTVTASVPSTTTSTTITRTTTTTTPSTTTRTSTLSSSSTSASTTTTRTTTTTPQTTTRTTTTTPQTTTRTTTATPSTTTRASTPSSSSSTTKRPCQPCGTVNRVSRIVGGVETEVNEYPWQVAIVYAGTSSVFCGGSLLNDRIVVTAAHCILAIYNSNIIAEVLLGAHNLSTPTGTQQRTAIAASGYHANYNASTFDHDIGYLLLSSSVLLSERVKPVCLPDVLKDYSGYQAVTSGWGTLSEGGPQPIVLNEVDVPILTNEACSQSYNGWVTSNMICAGYASGGKDSCQGDSGGPLVVDDSGRWVLVGITSWGNGCARPGNPGVYTRVTRYISILVELMNQYGANNLCNGTTAVPTSTSTATSTNASLPSNTCRCGRRNPVVRIVGGQPTTVHEYPWQVSLTTQVSNRPFCGGSIISNQWVLTAAHCAAAASPSNLYVVIGEHNWATTSETNVTQKIKALFMIVHPQYNSNTLDNDMALIKLESAVTFPADNKIAPVCLPDPGNAYANVNATVTGWGTTASGGTQPQELYEVVVPTMTNTKCQQSYGTNSITANMICAGVDVGGKDSCQGDSGGPLVTEVNAVQTFMVQIGVVSWGNGCALPNYPGVYARVNNYLDWISANIAGSETCPRP
ncbi:transmembrane protease serine 9-like [Macrobrachium nipponense]|uniref:transmembrane protease serine 9-like n=1 Tax=Macrobrachium nipponense TaxID=159736 RepID=UPI0030C89E5C